MSRRRDGYWDRDGRDRSRSRESYRSSRSRSRCAPRHWRGRRGRSRSFSRGYRGPPRGREGGPRGGKGKGHRDGDWICPSCSFSNYASRTECLRCKAPRPASGDHRRADDRGARPASPVKDGGYAAPVHGNHQGYGPPPARPPGYDWNGMTGYAAAAWNPYGYTMPHRDYAVEKPDAYTAFLHCVRRGADGLLEVLLCDRMCQDQHVADLLACVESWLMRELGNPSMTGQAWRLGKLDLARNGLSDDNIAGILERMKQWGLRLRRLNLDENCAAAKGATALVEYVWNCPEALLEVGLADNMVAVNGLTDADDPFSALIRCLYNHPGYPYRSQMEKGTQIFPLILRLAGNNIIGGRELLRRIQSQGGASHMRFCSSPDGYVGANDEYLSVFLPDFDRQRTATPVMITGGDAEVAAQAALPAEVPQAPVVAAPATQVQEHGHARQEDRGRPQEPALADQGPPQAAQPDPSDADDESYSEDEEEEEEEEVDSSEYSDEEEEEEGGSAVRESLPQDQAQEPAADSVAAAVVEAAFPVELEASATSGSKAAYPNPALEMPPLPSTDLSDIPLALQLEMQKDLESDASRSSGAADDGATAGKAADGLASAAQAGQPAKIKVKRRKLRKVKKGGGKRVDGKKVKPFGSLQTGDTADGKITLVKEKFVMVDFGAEVEGMLYVTNMSKRGRVREIFEVGDPVTASVYGLCSRRMRVSLQQRREQVVLKSNVEVMQDKAAMAEGIPPGMPRPKRRAKALEDGADGVKSGNNSVHKGEGGESSLLEIVDESLTSEEQKLLQSDIIDYLENTPDLSNDGLPLEEVKEDIAELAVCCLMTKMKTPIVESELSPYLNDHTSSFVSWLAAHLRGPWLRKRRERAGATPKAGAGRNKRTS